MGQCERCFRQPSCWLQIMWAHTAASHSVIVRLMGQFELIVPNKIGLPEGLRVIGCRLLCCRPACLHRQGAAIHTMGQCERFVRQPSCWLQIMQAHTAASCSIIMRLMGQFKAIVPNKIGLPKGCPLDCISKEQQFILWANASGLFRSHSANSK